MKNIAILDFTLSKTHIRFNIANFEQLRKIANLYIVNCENYYNDFAKNYNNVTLFESGIVFPRHKTNSITGRIFYVDNMKRNSTLFDEYKGVHFDAIIIMGFEIITLALYIRLFPKNIPIYIFQHQQLDELKNGIKRMFFNTFKNRVHHIVLEENYKLYIERRYGTKQVHVVHNISYVSVGKSEKKDCDLLLAISSNNDDLLISQIIEKQRTTNFLQKCNKRMYIRSAHNSYKDEYLFVGYEYLSAECYDKMFQEAEAIIGLVPDYFHHRVSGPVMDAIATGKPVLCSNKYIYDTYAYRAPSMFKYFSCVDELIKIIEGTKLSVDVEDLNNIQKSYQPEHILKEYSKFLLQ